MSNGPYNPLDKRNLGESVANALLNQEILPLDALSQFKGAGIYALYYTGPFPAYRVISERNQDGRFEVPIYVGSALPPGGRRGRFGLENANHTKLFTRLSKHLASIRQTENLEVADFHYRFLVVDDIWIPLGEQLMISHYCPLWNQKLDGFGNHDPGSGRYNQLRSCWDTLHPGRPWALKCREREETPDQLRLDVEAFLRD